jgi:hypothetical protein
MSKGKPYDVCRTCGSEIVETVNDSLFREGECDGCEYQRYCSQPELLRLARSFQCSCEERLSILRDERGIFDEEEAAKDIDDQIGHWTTLLERCDAILADWPRPAAD